MSWISIHALREEGDYEYWAMSFRSDVISIHALREEGDPPGGTIPAQTAYFYPRPPRGGRPMVPMISMTLGNFYPRPPRGGRPIVQQQGGWGKLFLSTPSARRATFELPEAQPDDVEFLSTPSARRATSMRCFTLTAVIFLSTPSARRAT